MPKVTMPIIYSKQEVCDIIKEHASKLGGETVKGSGVEITVACAPQPEPKRQPGDAAGVSPMAHDLESITVTFTKPERR